jgi:hypothetical protein
LVSINIITSKAVLSLTCYRILKYVKERRGEEREEGRGEA